MIKVLSKTVNENTYLEPVKMADEFTEIQLIPLLLASTFDISRMLAAFHNFIDPSREVESKYSSVDGAIAKPVIHPVCALFVV